MRFNALLLLLGLSCLYLALAQGIYEDCCLKYVKYNRKYQRLAVKYRVQETDGGCNIPAIIFNLRRGRVLCTNPRDSWVEDLIKHIDKKTGPHRSHPHKPSRG